MKNKIISVIVVILLLILDWAALHDIIKGNEESFMAEYLILLISLIVFAVMLIFSMFSKNRTSVKDGNKEAH